MLSFCIFFTLLYNKNFHADYAGTIPLDAARLNSGKFKNTLLDRNGVLSLAPGCERFEKIDETVLWKMYAYRDHLYIGTGHNGKIIVLNPENLRQYTMELPSPEILSLRAEGNYLYAGTGPRGIIYRIDLTTQKSEVFSALEADYIWDLRIKDSVLYAAVGTGGKIFAIDLDSGKKEVFFSSSEDNIMRIDFFMDKLLAASSGRGYLYLIKDKSDFDILLDAGGKDIIDFHVMHNTFYAVTAGKKMITPAGVHKQKMQADQDSYFINEILTADQNGFISSLEQFKNISITSIHGYDDTLLITGSGLYGSVFSVNILTGKSDQKAVLENIKPVSLIKSGEKYFFLGSDSGSVFSLEMQYPESGTFTTDVIDAERRSKWGSVTWNNRINHAGLVSWSARTGNTRNTGTGWTDWIQCTEGWISNHPSRYIQLKCRIFSTNTLAPELTDIMLCYTQSARYAVIKNIFFDRNESLIKHHKLNLEPHDKIVHWHTENPDKKPVQYTLQSRNADVSRDWQTLAASLPFPFMVLDSHSLPDGFYEFGVICHESAARTPTVTNDFLVSRTYLIDNTPPEVTGFNCNPTDKKMRTKTISFNIKDELSIIFNVSYSIEPNMFIQIFPDDGVFDEKTESFTIVVPELSSYLILHTADFENNSRFFTLMIK